MTERQTAGRGRMGRVWEAPAGSSVLLSVMLRPPAGRRLPEISLVGGLAAAEAVEEQTGLEAAIKWPNDVVVRGEKVAGLLAEVRDGAVVLGIGINVSQAREELPQTPIVPAGSLRTVTGRIVERRLVLVSFLDLLERRYRTWVADGLGALHEAIAARDFLRGRAVLVDGEEATATGIDSQGRLGIVVRSGARRTVESGEVTVAVNATNTS